MGHMRVPGSKIHKISGYAQDDQDRPGKLLFMVLKEMRPDSFGSLQAEADQKKHPQNGYDQIYGRYGAYSRPAEHAGREIVSLHFYTWGEEHGKSECQYDRQLSPSPGLLSLGGYMVMRMSGARNQVNNAQQNQD